MDEKQQITDNFEIFYSIPKTNFLYTNMRLIFGQHIIKEDFEE